MTAEEQFEIYKADFEKKQKKRARITYMLLGLAAVLVVLFAMASVSTSLNANFQRTNANRKMAEILELEKVIKEQQSRATELEKKLTECKAQSK